MPKTSDSISGLTKTWKICGRNHHFSFFISVDSRVDSRNSIIYNLMDVAGKALQAGRCALNPRPDRFVWLEKQVNIAFAFLPPGGN